LPTRKTHSASGLHLAMPSGGHTPPGATTITTAIAAPVTAALTALYAELAEEIPDVLTESFTFAALWADLARIAGEPLPGDVAAVLDAPLDLAPPTAPFVPQRGSYAAHAEQFAEAYAD